MTDDLERRLTAALRAEADGLEPRSTSWSGRINRSRRGPATWLAVAAVVAVLIVGVTVALSGNRGTAGHPAAPAGPDAAACAGGWTGYGTAVVTGRGQRVPAGTSAVLRFADGTPTAATLCAVISGPGILGEGYTTLASGVAGYRDAALGYLAVLGGDERFVVGAFGNAAASVSVDEVLPPEARGRGWSIAVTASTPGVTDLGNGWHGYAVLVPAGSASVQVTAVSTAGAMLAGTRLAVPTARSASTSTSVSSTVRPTARLRTSPAPPCSTASAVVGLGITDVGPGGDSIEADYDAGSREMCFVDSRGSVRQAAKAGALPFSGTTMLGSGPGVWGAVTSAATTVTLTDQQHPIGQVLDLQALGPLRFYDTGIAGRATITVFGTGAKRLASVTY